MRRGFANGAFEELEEDVPAVVEEFYPPVEPGEASTGHSGGAVNINLRGRLAAKVASIDGV